MPDHIFVCRHFEFFESFSIKSYTNVYWFKFDCFLSVSKLFTVRTNFEFIFVVFIHHESYSNINNRI